MQDGDDAASSSGASTQLAADSTVGTTAVPPKRLDDDVLPGTPFDEFPVSGAALTVVGIQYDDVLDIRIGPGPEYQIVTTLAPTSAGDAVATGRNRAVESGVWAEIEIGDIVGWANTDFLLQSGPVNDDTATLYPESADRPTGESAQELGREVARTYASLEPVSSITVVDQDRDGGITTVIIDVLGLEDDSVGGYRVEVSMSANADGYRVRSVKTTTLCNRAVSDGVCV